MTTRIRIRLALVIDERLVPTTRGASLGDAMTHATVPTDPAP